VVVAPAAGTFHRHGATGPSERRVGVVRHRGGESPVDTADATRLLEWLADDGDPVTQGQPLARVLVDGKTDRS
jgi:biotin carboxyl carrier protein